MGLPTINDVQAIEPILTNMLLAYQNQANNFVASRVFPRVSVPHDSGTYYVFTQKYWFLDQMAVRAPGADYRVGEFGVETDTYKTIQYALGWRIADEVRANSLVPMDLESAAVQWLAQNSLIRKERAWAADFMLTNIWGAADGSIGSKWSDYQNSDPVANILTGKRTISQATGYQVNTIVMGEIVRDRLINHPDMLDRIKYTTAAGVGSVEAAIAAIFGIPNILVGSAIYNTANENQTASYSPIIDDDILILYVEQSPRLMSASAGYTFAWDGGGGTGVVMRNRQDENDADLIKTKEQWDQKQVASYLGYIYLDATD